MDGQEEAGEEMKGGRDADYERIHTKKKKKKS